MRDIDIRRVLMERMKSLHAADTGTLIREELALCQGTARVDVAVVNGRFHGYEIKSERDTLTRLPLQEEIYSRALEFVTIVAAPQHIAQIDALIPKWWGIWEAIEENSSVELRVLREEKPNPELSRLALAQFLWRDEALDILEKHGLCAGMRSKSRQHLWSRLATSFEVDKLGEIVRERLKARGSDWKAPLPLT